MKYICYEEYKKLLTTKDSDYILHDVQGQYRQLFDTLEMRSDISLLKLLAKTKVSHKLFLCLPILVHKLFLIHKVFSIIFIYSLHFWLNFYFWFVMNMMKVQGEY